MTNVKKQLYILTDADGHFHLSMPDLVRFESMDVGKMVRLFEGYGFEVRVRKFHELALDPALAGTYIVYQTSEKRGLFYKRYIEDIVYALEMLGAIPLPRFAYLKAHHNKVYSEMLRSSFRNPDLKTLSARWFGSEEEALMEMPRKYPVVMKSAAGSGSDGVFLARNEDEYLHCARLISHVVVGPDWTTVAKLGIKEIIRRSLAFAVPRFRLNDPPVRESILVQAFVPDLKGDYKVLYYGGKYFLLYRQNREGDFRASGGGKLFEVPEAEQEGLLDFAKLCVEEIKFPMIGIDVAFDGSRYHLLEFQMIHLGPYTMQAAKYWHTWEDGGWVRHEGKADVEEEYCRSIAEFMRG
jgi:glutathione synthase/RimK-type ligase-like ATP-grasp enzyme